ncbi:MAG: phosphodiester glycosidase family protein [bacterium]
MVKKIFIIFIAILLLSGISNASTLYKVRAAEHQNKIRLVFDFSGAFSYETDETKKELVIKFANTLAGPEIKDYVEVNDLVVRYLKIERLGEADLKITIPLAQEVDYNIFYLNDPPRLVIDFERDFLSITSGGTIKKGITFLEVKQGTASGLIKAHVLKIDLDQVYVKPALAMKYNKNFVESFVSLITPWMNSDKKKHFFIEKVSEIAGRQNAVAAINGTFFASNGVPLGALLIDQELVSSPIYDRTALFFDEKNIPYIDNVSITSSFKIEDGGRYTIQGVNQSRGANEIIMYTPIWGERTGSNSAGIELVVRRSKISEINISNSEIPKDGYVLSAQGQVVESLSENAGLDKIINTGINIIPHDASPIEIIQLVSGGPRLLKNGLVYVSKHEEKFQNDIAKGRAARTAVGITKQQDLLLVTVDGRLREKRILDKSQDSIGATLEELSKIMLSLGATEAMNLDGGSSSTMVINNEVVNLPTSGYERRVSNALLLFPKENN